MDIVRFYYQFFTLSVAQLDQVLRKAMPPPSMPWGEFLSLNPFTPRTLREDFTTVQEALDFFQEVKQEERERKISTTYAFDPQFPDALKKYLDPEDCPLCLFHQGAFPLPEEPQLVAIVGTRQASKDGKSNARDFANFLALQNIRLVSGLAKGIDAEALEEYAEGSLAILGGPLAPVYPACNTVLAEKILTLNGTILSAYPLGQVPLPRNFPERNKLIAALTAGTIVIEGMEQSGAAITGKLALAMGKTTVALTENFRSPFGRGAIRLYEAGATLVTSEEESLQAIYARFGGRALSSVREKRSSRSFTLSAYLKAEKYSLQEGIQALEREILLGNVIRVGAQKFRRV